MYIETAHSGGLVLLEPGASNELTRVVVVSPSGQRGRVLGEIEKFKLADPVLSKMRHLIPSHCSVSNDSGRDGQESDGASPLGSKKNVSNKNKSENSKNTTTNNQNSAGELGNMNSLFGSDSSSVPKKDPSTLGLKPEGALEKNGQALGFFDDSKKMGRSGITGGFPNSGNPASPSGWGTSMGVTSSSGGPGGVKVGSNPPIGQGLERRGGVGDGKGAFALAGVGMGAGGGYGFGYGEGYGYSPGGGLGPSLNENRDRKENNGSNDLNSNAGKKDSTPGAQLTPADEYLKKEIARVNGLPNQQPIDAKMAKGWMQKIGEAYEKANNPELKELARRAMAHIYFKNEDPFQSRLDLGEVRSRNRSLGEMLIRELNDRLCDFCGSDCPACAHKPKGRSHEG